MKRNNVRVKVSTNKHGDTLIKFCGFLLFHHTYLFPCTASSQQVSERVNTILKKLCGEQVGYTHEFFKSGEKTITVRRLPKGVLNGEENYITIDTGVDVPSEGV